jgi:1-deoxy-D-xylulose-5-phosphate synthase
MKLALEFALSQSKPVVIRYPKDIVPPQKYVRAASSKPFVLGESVTVKSSKDSEIAIVSYGCLLSEALDAAAMLAKEGIPVDVINGRFAAPVDNKIVSLLDKGKGIITVEDHHLACGFGSALLETAALEAAQAKKTAQESAKSQFHNTIRMLGVPRELIRHDSRRAQLMQVGVNADKIVQTAKEMLGIAPGLDKV